MAGPAFYLPNGFAADNTTVDLLRWEGSGHYGGVSLRYETDRFHLVRGVSGSPITLLGDREPSLDADPRKDPRLPLTNGHLGA